MLSPTFALCKYFLMASSHHLYLIPSKYEISTKLLFLFLIFQITEDFLQNECMLNFYAVKYLNCSIPIRKFNSKLLWISNLSMDDGPSQ